MWSDKRQRGRVGEGERRREDDMMAHLRQQGISRPSHIEEMRADVAAMLTRSDREDIARLVRK
jgi:hypothetical protein